MSVLDLNGSKKCTLNKMKKRHWDQGLRDRGLKPGKSLTTINLAEKRGLIPIVPIFQPLGETATAKTDLLLQSFDRPQPHQVKSTFKSMVLLISHIWNEEIFVWYKTLKASLPHDFEIIVIAVDKIFTVPSEVSILRPALAEIETLYSSKIHHNLWASNHWILMWFWKTLGHFLRLEHVWSIEYDVRSSGPLEYLWSIDSSIDYVSSTPIENVNTLNSWSNSVFWTTKKFTAQKQIFRTSKKFLDYLDTQFKKGFNGQDEITLATHAIEGFVCSSLSQYLHTSWSPTTRVGLNQWVQYDSENACSQKTHNCHNNNNNALDGVKQKLFLFHPVK